MFLTALRHVALTRRPFPPNPEGHLGISVIEQPLPLRTFHGTGSTQHPSTAARSLAWPCRAWQGLHKQAFLILTMLTDRRLI